MTTWMDYTPAGWKSLVTSDDGRMLSLHGSTAWVLDRWNALDESDTMEFCACGFHCSPSPLAALGYIPSGTVMARVEGAGDVLHDHDKSVWREMRVREAWAWTPNDIFALAEQALMIAMPTAEAQLAYDARGLEQYQAARKLLRQALADLPPATTDPAHRLVFATPVFFGQRDEVRALTNDLDDTVVRLPMSSQPDTLVARMSLRVLAIALTYLLRYPCLETTDMGRLITCLVDFAEGFEAAAAQALDDWLVSYIQTLRPYTGVPVDAIATITSNLRGALLDYQRVDDGGAIPGGYAGILTGATIDADAPRRDIVRITLASGARFRVRVEAEAQEGVADDQ